MSPKSSKRARSPCLAELSNRGRALGHEPCQTRQSPCGCPASREVRRLETRVAELEAELQRKTALLTDDFHDDPEIQQLRHRVQPDDGDDTYAAATLRAAWRVRISNAFIETVREIRETDETGNTYEYSVDPALAGSWCVPHAAVPHLVSSSVVMSFLKPDVVFVGSRGLTATVCVNGPALAQIDVLRGLFTEAQSRGLELTFYFRLPIREVLRDLCAARLSKHGLGDFFLMPAARGANLQVAWSLAWCLVGVSREASHAALFCTADIRDRFFIALYQQDPGGQNVSYEMAVPIAEALTKITAAVSRAQRQEVFATEEFRDAVLVRLVRRARGDADAVALVRAAFLNIAENEDGSLHDVFMGDACRASILEPLQSAPLSSAQLFKQIRGQGEGAKNNNNVTDNEPADAARSCDRK